MRRFHELALVRSRHPVLALTWTAFHPIDADSPLHGATAQSLEEVEAAITISLVGIDDTFSQSVYARYAYNARDIVFGARLADILITLPDGRQAADYTRFHDIEPVRS